MPDGKYSSSLIMLNFIQIRVHFLQNFQEFPSHFQFSFSILAIFRFIDKFLNSIIEFIGNFSWDKAIHCIRKLIQIFKNIKIFPEQSNFSKKNVEKLNKIFKNFWFFQKLFKNLIFQIYGATRSFKIHNHPGGCHPRTPFWGAW